MNWLPSIQVAICMSEPSAGIGLTDLATQCVEDGDRLVIDGQKRWTSGGNHADGFVVYCRMSDAPGVKGIGAVYVERDTDGVSCRGFAPVSIGLYMMPCSACPRSS